MVSTLTIFSVLTPVALASLLLYSFNNFQSANFDGYNFLANIYPRNYIGKMSYKTVGYFPNWVSFSRPEP